MLGQCFKREAKHRPNPKAWPWIPEVEWRAWESAFQQAHKVAHVELENLRRICQSFCLYAHAQEDGKTNLRGKPVCGTNSKVILSIPSRACNVQAFGMASVPREALKLTREALKLTRSLTRLTEKGRHFRSIDF